MIYYRISYLYQFEIYIKQREHKLADKHDT